MVLAPRIYNIITSQTKCITYGIHGDRIRFFLVFSASLFVFRCISLYWFFCFIPFAVSFPLSLSLSPSTGEREHIRFKISRCTYWVTLGDRTDIFGLIWSFATLTNKIRPLCVFFPLVRSVWLRASYVLTEIEWGQFRREKRLLNV